MSTDYFLVSPSRNRSVMVGSNGFSGVQSFPCSDDVVEFIKWVIEEGVRDVVLVDEHQLDDMNLAGDAAEAMLDRPA